MRKKSSLLLHMVPKPHKGELFAWGFWGWWGWCRCCMSPWLPPEGSQVISKGLGQGCRWAAKEIHPMQHCSQGGDSNNTSHLQLQAGMTNQALAKVHKKMSGPSGWLGRQRHECGPWAGSSRRLGRHCLPSGSCHSRRGLQEGEGLGIAAQWLCMLGAR